ncbi:MAG: SDR family oxidoreductase [Alphaproteobacteria bacterium]|nr:SDR family oxidoreductase [Alphaproteobacteria bacterium]
MAIGKCLVTGGAGFIGSHLVDRLLEDGHQVVVIDNFSTGRPENLGHVADNPRLSIHQADIASSDIRPLFEGVRHVFHLAALADIVPSIQQAGPYHHANVNGTLAVLEASRHAGVERFVCASSSSCYGIPDVYPTPESAPPRPMYPYALTKWVAECYVQHWHQTYGLPTVSLRMFNVFGPRSRTSGTYGAVFGVFLKQKLAGKPFTVVGDGSQTRDFTYVTDVVDAFVTAAASQLGGEIMNVGSGGHYSINRLVELLGGPVVHIPKRPGEPDCTFADTSRISSLLKWTPRISFEDGVALVLEHIDYWKEAPLWTPDSIAEATADWFKFLGNDR